MRSSPAVAAMLPLFFFLGCSPCFFSTDEDACLRALENAPLLSQVKLDMTPAEVQSVMKKPPERREAEGSIERWHYMSDYEAELMTEIEFRDGRVTAIRLVPWRSE